MFYIAGLIIAFGSLTAAVIHLDQSFASYYDFVGVVMVFGGTIAIAAITLPWDMHKEIFYRLKELIVRPLPDRKNLLLQCLKAHENILSNNFSHRTSGKDLPSRILNDGVELIQLGFATDKVGVILKERLFQAVERTRYISSQIRSLAKYPPAFGLAGTVLGLVHLMRGVSDGMSPQETGVRMAIALVATFYGLLVANLVVGPVGEAIAKNAHEEEKLGEIALQSILLSADKVNMLEAQEMLNSFVAENDRVDVLGLKDSTEEPSSATATSAA